MSQKITYVKPSATKHAPNSTAVKREAEPLVVGLLAPDDVPAVGADVLHHVEPCKVPLIGWFSAGDRTS